MKESIQEVSFSVKEENEQIEKDIDNLFPNLKDYYNLVNKCKELENIAEKAFEYIEKQNAEIATLKAELKKLTTVAEC